MNNFLIAGNWKMNKTIAEAKEFAEAIKKESFKDGVEIAILAPYTQLATLGTVLNGSNVCYGAQNVHQEASGAYTGEISAPMLAELGIKYCIVGHSERRQYFNESDKSVNEKLKALFSAGITPILCVGEPLEVREMNTQFVHVGGQLFSDLDGLTYEQMQKLVIAYEPIWAIGTGKNATAVQADEMCGFIRGTVEGFYGTAIADSMMLLYGGSMKPENAREILSANNINGGLIGGASLNKDSLIELARIAEDLL